MCGIAGGWGLRGFAALRSALPRMTAAIAHRGPDAEGFWSDAEAGLALGHRRLSILDLSDSGAQPMVSASGRWVVVFNGEIYNHAALRHTLEACGRAPAWRGHSDTETLLAAIDAWGCVEAIQRCAGMFAIGLWDRRNRELWLLRDRVGEKPLYYGLWNGTLVFASELRALREAPGFSGDVDRDALALMLRYNALPAPYSIHSGISKLPAGSWLRVRERDLRDGRLPQPEAFWSVAEAARSGAASPFQGSSGEAVDALEGVLGDAVGLQMVADVPLGAFLSGGIDSSTIVALMQARSRRPVKTFTIGFDEPGFDEAGHARDVARHLGTEHTELYVRPEDALAVIPRLPEIYDEPFADSSQIPTFLVSRLAREHVTVSLSGDGGDELFLGYPRYLEASERKQRLERWPMAMRQVAGRAARSTPEWFLASLRNVGARLPAAAKLRNLDDARMERLGESLAARDPMDRYHAMMSGWTGMESVVPGARPLATAYQRQGWRNGLGFVESLGVTDLMEYLPNDILTKVDRAAMAVSLETRIPMLDHRVVEFALSLPLDLKWRDGQDKWVLRQLAYRHVPRQMLERPKMGFGVPMAAWLRGPLREWADALLDPAVLRAQGFLDAAVVHRKWSEHRSGRRDWQYHLWGILMFQAWLQRQSIPVQPQRERLAG